MVYRRTWEPEFHLAEAPYGAGVVGQARPRQLGSLMGKLPVACYRRWAAPSIRGLPRQPGTPRPTTARARSRVPSQGHPQVPPHQAGLTSQCSLGRRRRDGRRGAGAGPAMARDPLGGGGALSPGRPGWRSRGRGPLGRKEAGAAGRSTTRGRAPLTLPNPPAPGPPPRSSRPRIGQPRLDTPPGFAKPPLVRLQKPLKGAAPDYPNPQ